MALGKGGSSQNQSGTQEGTTSGTTSGTSSATGSVTPTTTSGWNSADANIQGILGNTGLTGGQQDALGGWQDYLRNPNNGVMQMIGANNGLQQFTSPSANLAGASGPVVANQGAAYSGAYKNPYEEQVVQSTIGDMTNAFDKTQNQLRAQYGGQGWSPTAGAPSGEQVAAGESATGFLKNLGGAVAGLRSQGFDTANRFGAADAGNALQASGQNASLNNQLSMFNAGQNDTADARSMTALNNISNNAANQVGVGGQAVQQSYNMAGGGLNNLYQYLGLQPTGQSSTQSGTTSGTSSGTSSGSSTGSGSGKSGGLSIG